MLAFCTEVKFQQMTPALNSLAVVQDLSLLINHMGFLFHLDSHRPFNTVAQKHLHFAKKNPEQIILYL